MDKETRNKLRNAVVECRKLLEADVLDQLEGTFGIHRDGRIEPETALPHLDDEGLEVRRRAIAAIEHIQGYGLKQPDAVDQFQREVAFTHLNRLCAFKMLERRDLLEEAVSRGTNSNGFKVYLASHPDDERRWQSGDEHLAYKNFLFDVCAQLSEEIKVLFDTEHVSSHLFPNQRALEGVLELINAEPLADIWESDETIGWIYQYFTPKELREKARKESAAPRNSYELAFRNQFYTPRYVVQFLTDNTLGRTWYEMRKGETRLVDQCEYMVRRPTEIFLGPVEEPPPEPEHDGDMSQEELLKQRVHVRHREKKVPWEIKILDPACGSGHFLLYAFNVLETIYDEAYDDPDIGPRVQALHPDRRRYAADVPAMILRHNLHGIDIDLRSTQIAALALWMRAQRSYQRLGLSERPKIEKTNIVCAEPMPGDEALLDEFCDGLQPSLLGDLVREVWGKMKLAGEAGSLLKIEEEIRDVVRRAQEAWRKAPKGYKISLFDGTVQRPVEQAEFDFSEVTGPEFWQKAETLLLDALALFASRAANGREYGRRLFADDAEQGFAFVELCRMRFDVVLMNPPFGELPIPAAGYLKDAHGSLSKDVAGLFLAAARSRLSTSGIVGALAPRAMLFLKSNEACRRAVMLEDLTLRNAADLGLRVMDDAWIETVALTTSAATNDACTIVRLLDSPTKERDLRMLLAGLRDGKADPRVVSISPVVFLRYPYSIVSYWLPRTYLELFSGHETIEDAYGTIRQGLATADDFRFLRMWAETPPHELGPRFLPFAKGGAYSPFFGIPELIVLWEDDGAVYWKETSATTGLPRSNIWMLEETIQKYFGRPGLTYTQRTNSAFSPRVLPAGCVFATKGESIFCDDPQDLPYVLGVTQSRPFQILVEAFVATADSTQSEGQARSYLSGVIKKLPLPKATADVRERVASSALEIIEIQRARFLEEESFQLFVCPGFNSGPLATAGLLQRFLQHHLLRLRNDMRALTSSHQIETHARHIYGLSDHDQEFIDGSLGPHPEDFSGGFIDSPTLELYQRTEEGILRFLRDKGITGRAFVNPSYHSSRKIEIISQLSRVRGAEVAERVIQGGLFAPQDLETFIRDIISYVIGVALGRWDIRFAADPSLVSPLGDPFAPLPASSPGMLVGPDGLPGQSGRLASGEWLRARPNAITLPPEGSVSRPTIPDSEYPLQIVWDGILVDDADHQDDIVRRAREVLELLWGERAEAIEQEACGILGVNSLREYFRNPKHFWDDHVKRYSKSRRKAPIYWLLQSPGRRYALWLYYHRLDRDMLYKALRNYVDPKHRREESSLKELRDRLPATPEGRERKVLEKQIDEQEAVVNDVLDLKERLEKVTKLGLDPDLNDGVVLNIAPLHELVPWKEPKKYWDDLLAGKYEWSTIGKQLREKGLVRG